MNPLYPVDVRGWPGTKHWRAPWVPPAHSGSLGDRPALVMAMAGVEGIVPEAFGLGVYLRIMGPSVVDGGFIVPDDLDRSTVAGIRSWATANPIASLQGPQPWAVCTLSEFFDHRHGIFIRSTYTGHGWCIGVDLGRVFGLGAEHWCRRAEPHRDTWEVWPPGWGKVHDRRRVKRVSPHRPCLRIRSRRVGWQVEYGPVEAGNGIWEGHTYRRGVFLDLLSAAYVLDADRGASYGEHRSNFGLRPMEVPLSSPLDREGACAMAQAVRGIHEFSLVLARHSSLWFPPPMKVRRG